MGISHVRVMEPILEKLAIAIRTSQFTDAHQNRVILSIGLVGLALVIAIVIYLYVKYRVEARNDQQPPSKFNLREFNPA